MDRDLSTSPETAWGVSASWWKSWARMSTASPCTRIRAPIGKDTPPIASADGTRTGADPTKPAQPGQPSDKTPTSTALGKDLNSNIVYRATYTRARGDDANRYRSLLKQHMEPGAQSNAGDRDPPRLNRRLRARFDGLK
jgi:hypothetical protein